MISEPSNISEVIKIVQDSFVELLEGEISDYELSIISKSIRNPMVRTFTTSAAMTERIQEILSNLSELNYLRSKLIQKRYRLSISYRAAFDKQYTLLTRIGRPSRAAIESEIFSTDESLFNQKLKLEEFDNMIEYLQTQIDLNQSTIHNYESQKYHT